MLLVYSYFTFLESVKAILVHCTHRLLSKLARILCTLRNRPRGKQTPGDFTKLRSIPEPHAFSTVIFYGLRNSNCKTAQFCATRCESEMAEIPGVRDPMQRGENGRKKPFLNYETVALPAELRRRGRAKDCIHGRFRQAGSCSRFAVRSVDTILNSLQSPAYVVATRSLRPTRLRGATARQAEDAVTAATRMSRRFHVARCAPEFCLVPLQSARSVHGRAQSSGGRFDDAPEQ